MTGPFHITGPAVVSFSGGRTSAYMLHRIIQAHGGTLPDDVVVLFQNTGREMSATLDFVRDCAAAWSVPIRWLEYRWRPGGPSYAVVNHNSASRNGEPFAMAIKAKSYLPNPMARFCTGELKVRTAQRFIRDTLGWKRWTSAVGLRADEPGRVAKLTNPTQERHDDIVCPLAEAGIEEYHVLRFWREQPFNLRLRGRHEGNCDGCFLKGRGAISRMFRDYPERMAWWVEQEREIRHSEGQGATFRIDREDYASIARTTRNQGVLPFDLEDALPCTDAVCGI
jgi:3'-phosphoadenosine 5'-phosphosulfate sulfotransferase (PAPS reductase)/FAD synthetase